MRQHDFGFARLSFHSKARLYKSIIEPILLHGCLSFGLSRDDWAIIESTQAMIQRTFIRSANPDTAQRWIDIHSQLRRLRERGNISDTVATLERSLAKLTFPVHASEVIQYRNEDWQSQRFQGKPSRKPGRPSTTLARAMLAASRDMES